MYTRIWTSMLAVFALAGAALAMPTLGGWSGGFQVPTAEVQQGITLSVNDVVSGGQPLFSRGQYQGGDTIFVPRGGSVIPRTQLLIGLGSALEASFGYEDAGFSGSGQTRLSLATGSTWNATMKYALPYTLWTGKLAAGLAYSSTSDGMFDTTAWHGLLTGTFPVFSSMQGTAAVIFNSEDFGEGSDQSTTYALGLEQPFKNGTALGLEYLVNVPDFFGDADYGNAYVKFPINEMLTGRVALSGINESTSFVVGVTAAL